VESGFFANQVRGAPESLFPFPNALKTKKRNAVKGKPPTMDTKPAATECHLMQPNTKSKTAQIEKKSRGLGRFISSSFSSSFWWLDGIREKAL
jgi:hypothetical protein